MPCVFSCKRRYSGLRQVYKMQDADQSNRLYNCALCRCQVVICRECDHGNRYCKECGPKARRRNMADNARRYQKTAQGRRNHADRQRRYRERKHQEMRNVTHQGPTYPQVSAKTKPSSEIPIASDKRQLPTPSTRTYCCHYCLSNNSKFMRNDFLRYSKSSRKLRISPVVQAPP